tara:strand:- start:2659 stop:3654 length:996 start_codon:yes stop_codon:yes gene_type:complete
MNTHIKEYISFKKKHEGYLSIPFKDRMLKIKKELGEKFDFHAKSNELADKIIKEAFDDNLTLENIREIPEKYFEREKILKKVTDYLSEKEARQILEIEITNEDKFRRICEAALKDGVLTNEEEKNIEFESEILGIEKNKAEDILKQAVDRFEIAKPKEFIMEVLGTANEHEKTKMTLDEIYKEISSDKYDVDMSKAEVLTQIKKLVGDVVYDDKTKQYTLISHLETQGSRSFIYGSVTYTYSVVELARNNPYISFSFDPTKNECKLYINSKNQYFKNIQIKDALRDILFDGVVSHQINRIGLHSIDPSTSFLKLKEKISFQLATQNFYLPN